MKCSALTEMRFRATGTACLQSTMPLFRATPATRSGAAFDVLDIGNPVALSARKARLFPFAIEACRRATKERLINAFERVDADNRVKMVVDPTGDDGHYAAPGADVKLAVRVPNAYLDTSDGSLTTTFRAPFGLEVHTPPCLVQNEQVQARAGISAGSGSQVREKEMFPQWHLPWINMRAISVVAARKRWQSPARTDTA